MKRLTDKKIIDALHAAQGMVCAAAETLACPPELIYGRARTSTQVRGVLRFYRGKLLDAAEKAVRDGVLAGKAWAVRAAIGAWGRSRDFSDGAEAWHAPHAATGELPHELIRKLSLEMLNHAEFIQYLQSRQLASDAGPVCRPGQPGALENDAAPGGDRPGDRRDDPGPVGADSGD